MKAAIVGIADRRLTPAEHALFRAYPPVGIILFARNIQDRNQLAALMAELRRVLPPRAILMVDQEGGRVARLRPPSWRAHPPAAALHTLRRAWLSGALIGSDCADAAVVPQLGRPFAEGLLAAGIQPVGKHAPGHGRARVDSHLSLPTVEANHLDADLLPFARNRSEEHTSELQ